jgi:site-specific DNA recombinase
LSFEEYDISEGAVPAVVSKEIWQQAQAKLDARKGKTEKKEKDHEYLLSSLICCPKCGKAMYGRPGNGNQKNAKGEPYPTYYAYVCSSYLRSQDKCGFGQIACHKIDAQVRDILMALTTAENFGEKITELSHEYMDTGENEKLIDELKTRLRKAEVQKDKFELKQFQLDPTDKYFDQKYDRFDRQLESVYETITETSIQLMDAEGRLEAIKRQSLTAESIYECLKNFEMIYDQMTDYEKKIFLRSFVDKIELYPDKSRKHGCYVKSIDFLFPVSYKGEHVYSINLNRPSGDISSSSKTYVESVVTLINERTE